jgi:FlaG/FlaF family flagellin (archaellin)
MGREYTVVFQKVTISAAQDLLEITPADDKPFVLHGWHISNVGGTADAGDAQEELLPIEVIRGFTTSGSGGTAPTPRAADPGDSAASFTAEVNNTTLANTGTTNSLFEGGINIRIPDPFFFTEATRPKVNQGNTTMCVRLVDAPADAVVCSATFYLEEL